MVFSRGKSPNCQPQVPTGMPKCHLVSVPCFGRRPRRSRPLHHRGTTPWWKPSKFCQEETRPKSCPRVSSSRGHVAGARGYDTSAAARMLLTKTAGGFSPNHSGESCPTHRRKRGATCATTHDLSANGRLKLACPETETPWTRTTRPLRRHLRWFLRRLRRQNHLMLGMSGCRSSVLLRAEAAGQCPTYGTRTGYPLYA